MTTAIDPTQAGLLRDVLEHPREDGPRLVYADWCEDNGQDEWVLSRWSELIRFDITHQADPCQEHQIGMRAGPPRGEWLVRWGSLPGGGISSRADLERLAINLLHGSPSITGDYIFRRGFVSEIRLPLQAFLDHAETLFALHPIERVVLTDREPLQQDDFGFAWYLWSSAVDVSEHLWADYNREAIPRCLLKHLDKQDSWGVRAYDSADLARADISRACVRYGRDLHRLPPIDFED